MRNSLTNYTNYDAALLAGTAAAFLKYVTGPAAAAIRKGARIDAM